MRLLCHLLLAFAMLHWTAATAQRCGATCANTEAMLGMPEHTLVASIPELTRVPNPVKGPRNSRGKWMLSDFVFATQPYAVTYFVSAGRVIRIELLGTTPQHQCTQRIPFDLALSELQRTYGDSPVLDTLESDGKSVKVAAFHSNAADVALHFSMSVDDCATRVVYKTREVRDASEL